MNTKILTILVSLFLAVTLGCSSGEKSVTTNKNTVFIVDRNGRKWDITHAKNKYNMKPNLFNFGIGLGTIPSVDHPKIVNKDNPDYPKSTSEFLVFGVHHNGEQRAYGVSNMTRHEIFNDKYPGESDQYVAVAY